MIRRKHIKMKMETKNTTLNLGQKYNLKFSVIARIEIKLLEIFKFYFNFIRMPKKRILLERFKFYFNFIRMREKDLQYHHAFLDSSNFFLLPLLQSINVLE